MNLQFPFPRAFFVRNVVPLDAFWFEDNEFHFNMFDTVCYCTQYSLLKTEGGVFQISPST
jgi:hypothetical protein